LLVVSNEQGVRKFFYLDSLVGVDRINLQSLVTKPLAELRTPILKEGEK